ncbi:hypothetical protein CU254_41890 (plasmid) [Amycolatopsis sp. AA4]|uniref:hypothetical protein n=1 Tax=Actinomycetes TaxID=1760 RepID=UPI0001B56C2D|nr:MULTISPECIES: hypothetical protein [Actinomycetes]ATY17131.1 hypothetical protein CU254_41890 [Amycolatopsis sp. AA4]EFL12638.1 predicted protein [Streptomyces sp. AA4]
MPETPLQNLLALAAELDLDPLDLNDVVHDLHSLPASAINNGGLEAQITYLLAELGETELEELLRDAAPDCAAPTATAVLDAANHWSFALAEDPAPQCAAAPPRLADDDSAAAAEVRALWREITTRMAEPDGRWPAVDVSQYLAEWFAAHGFEDKPLGGEQE